MLLEGGVRVPLILRWPGVLPAGSEFSSPVTAMDLADPDMPVVPVDLSLEELLEEFHRANTGLLPVVEAAGNRKIVGLVEQRDLLRNLPRM